MVSGRICFVPSRAKQPHVSSAPDAQTDGTNLERDAGKPKDSLRDRVQLEDVSPSLVAIWWEN